VYRRVLGWFDQFLDEYDEYHRRHHNHDDD
jgi:hypothetical protein